MANLSMAMFIETSEIVSPFDKMVTSIFEGVRCAMPENSMNISLYKPEFAAPSSWNKYDILYQSELHGIKVYVDNNILFDTVSVYLTRMFGDRDDETDECIIWRTDTLFQKYKTIAHDTNALQFDIIAMEKEYMLCPTDSLKEKLEMAQKTWSNILVPLKESYPFNT
jgi:hypothetical protein